MSTERDIAKAKRILRDDGLGELAKRTRLYLDDLIRRRIALASRPFLNRLYRYTDARRVTSPDSVYSDSYYAKRQSGPLYRDAERISVSIYKALRPRSVIDLGCAIGHYLEPLYVKGVDVYGVDGHSAAVEHNIIPTERMEVADLRDSYEPPREFEVAICIEVAEHLAPEYAETLVESLTRCAPVVIFTAAPPGQGGTHHVNEQQPEYWIRLFANYGYSPDRDMKTRILEGIALEKIHHVKENMLVFREQ